MRSRFRGQRDRRRGRAAARFFAGVSRAAGAGALQARREAFPALAGEELLSGMLHPRLGKTLCHACGLGAQPLASGSDAPLEALVSVIKSFSLPVTGVSGFESAQVTAGGVRTAEFRADTLESRLAPGVFACGEVLDIDGDCGGYNLQWAWSSGFVAGKLGKL
ncbi:MAG: NAD(P)/FAD-dependent oxidoreductase [Acutalibacteraceae bacterium]